MSRIVKSANIHSIIKRGQNQFGSIRGLVGLKKRLRCAKLSCSIIKKLEAKSSFQKLLDSLLAEPALWRGE